MANAHFGTVVLTVSRTLFIFAALVAFVGILAFLPQPAQATTGGPDACGYTFIDSASPGGPVYNWQDVAGSGTPGPQSDDSAVTAILEFTFNFCNNNYTSVKMSSNGFICFNPSNSCTDWTANTIPAGSFSDPQLHVAGYWTDLYPEAGGVTWYDTLGTAPNRVFIAQWTNTQYCCSGPIAATFQIKLFETTNLIEAHYNSMTTDTHQGLAGIQDQSGTSGLTYLYSNVPSQWNALANTAVRYMAFVNSPPTPLPSTVNLSEDCNPALSTSGCATPATVTLTGSDPDAGDSRYYCIQTYPTSGVLASAPPSCPLYSTVSSPTLDIGYIPNADYCNGFGSFAPATNDFLRFKVKDSMVASAGDARVDLQVNCLADAPTATNDLYILWENCSPIAGVGTCGAVTPSYFAVGAACGAPPVGLKCSAGERDGDDLQVPAPTPANVHSAAARAILVDPPLYGTIRTFDGAMVGAISDDGSFRYIPNDNACGPDTFTYKLLDDNAPAGLTAPAYGNVATVTLTVTCTGTIPTAAADQRAAAVGYTMDTQLRALPSILSNDYDPEGDALTALFCSGPTVGVLGTPPYSPANPPIGANGHFRYTPPTGFIGIATFQYRARDTTGHTSPCTTVQINVQVDRPPVAAFSWYPADPKVAEPTSFTDGSTDADVGDGIAFWSWSFGDGQLSNQRNPAHIYGQASTMRACLTVADTYGQWGQPTCRNVPVSPTAGQDAPSAPKPAPDETEPDPKGLVGDLKVAAGPDILVPPGGRVTLQAVATGASGSVSHSWTQVDQNLPITLEGSGTAQATFTAPTAIPPGGRLVYYFAVRASDGTQAAEDAVLVTVQADRAPPVARIRGPDKVPAGDAFELDASASASSLAPSAQDGLRFRWMQVSGPATIIYDADTAKPRIVPTEPGVYSFAVEVSDGGGTGVAEHGLTVQLGPVEMQNDGFRIEVHPAGVVVLIPTVTADEYTWTFHDGTTKTSDGKITRVYEESGTYRIQMTARTGTDVVAFEQDADVGTGASRDVGDADTSAALPAWAWGVGVLALLGVIGGGIAYTVSRRRTIEPPGPV